MVPWDDIPKLEVLFHFDLREAIFDGLCWQSLNSFVTCTRSLKDFSHSSAWINSRQYPFWEGLFAGTHVCERVLSLLLVSFDRRVYLLIQRSHKALFLLVSLAVLTRNWDILC